MTGEVLADVGGGLAVDSGHGSKGGVPGGEGGIGAEEDLERRKTRVDLAEEVGGRGSGEDDLAVGGAGGEESAEQVRDGDGGLEESRGEGAEGAFGGFAEAFVLGELVEGEEGEDGGGVAGGFGAVVVVFDAEDEFGGFGGGEEGSGGGVFEEIEEVVGEAVGEGEVSGIEVGLIEIEEGLEEEGVIVEEAGDAGDAFAEAAEENAIGGEHVRAQKRGGALGGGEVAGFVEDGGGAGEGGDHKSVPGGEDFVIEVGADARRAGGEEGLGGAGEFGGQVGFGEAEAAGGFFQRT